MLLLYIGKHTDKTGLLAGPWTFGEAVVQGQRTDINALSEAIKQGHGLKRLAVDHTTSMLKYFGNAAKLVALIGEKKRNWMTELYIYTGPAGTGKSHAAHVEGQKYLDENNIQEEPYDMMVPGKGQKLWFQNYSGESVVIIDDFYGTISIDDMKRLIDK